MKFSLRDLIWATLVAALLLVIAISTLDYRTKKKELQDIVQNAIYSEEVARVNAEMAMKAEVKIRARARQLQAQQEAAEQKIQDLQRRALAIERLMESSTVHMFGKTIESTFNAKCVEVTNGDIIKCLNEDNEQVDIRLEAIVCPKRDKPFSDKAKEFTGELCHEKTVTLHVTGKDRLGRTSAFVEVDGKNVSVELLKAGLAEQDQMHSDDETLAGLEATAREDKVGLWEERTTNL